MAGMAVAAGLSFALLAASAVADATAPASAAPTGTLSTKTPTVTEGQPLTFSYATTPAQFNATNWIGIYSDPGCGPIDGTYVCGSTTYLYTPAVSGTETFATASLRPGKYIAFYLYDNGYTSLATPVPFTVTAVKPVAAPTFVSVRKLPAVHNPQSLTQGPGGDLWVAGAASDRIDELSAATGRVIRTIGGPGRAPGLLRDPRGVAVDSYGHVFVADTGNNRVEEYSTSGGYLATIGSEGTKAGEFENPEGVAVHDGILYVSDDANNRIEEFTVATGAYRSSITTDVSSPAGLTFDAKGDLWAAQQGQTETSLDGVVEYNPTTGQVLLALDGDNATTYGGFSNPTDVAVDAAGHVFVAEPDTDYVQEFTSTGVFLNEFGTSGRGTLSFPTGVIVTHAGGVVVADSGHGRLVTFKES